MLLGLVGAYSIALDIWGRQVTGACCELCHWALQSTQHLLALGVSTLGICSLSVDLNNSSGGVLGNIVSHCTRSTFGNLFHALVYLVVFELVLVLLLCQVSLSFLVEISACRNLVLLWLGNLYLINARSGRLLLLHRHLLMLYLPLTAPSLISWPGDVPLATFVLQGSIW